MTQTQTQIPPLSLRELNADVEAKAERYDIPRRNYPRTNFPNLWKYETEFGTFLIVPGSWYGYIIVHRDKIILNEDEPFDDVGQAETYINTLGTWLEIHKNELTDPPFDNTDGSDVVEGEKGEGEGDSDGGIGDAL